MYTSNCSATVVHAVNIFTPAAAATLWRADGFSFSVAFTAAVSTAVLPHLVVASPLSPCNTANAVKYSAYGKHDIHLPNSDEPMTSHNTCRQRGQCSLPINNRSSR